MAFSAIFPQTLPQNLPLTYLGVMTLSIIDEIMFQGYCSPWVHCLGTDICERGCWSTVSDRKPQPYND